MKFTINNTEICNKQDLKEVITKNKNKSSLCLCFKTENINDCNIMLNVAKKENYPYWVVNEIYHAKANLQPYVEHYLRRIANDTFVSILNDCNERGMFLEEK